MTADQMVCKMADLMAGLMVEMTVAAMVV